MGKLGKILPRDAWPFGDALEVGRGHRLLLAEPPARRRGPQRDVHGHLAGHDRRARGQRRAARARRRRGGVRRRGAAVRRRLVRPRPRPRRPAPPPRTSTSAFSEFHRVLRPGGWVAFCGEPSRRRRPAREHPQAGRVAGLARVAAADGRATRPSTPASTATPSRASSTSSTSTPSAPRTWRPRPRRRLRRRPRARRGAARQLVRLGEPRARGDGRARVGAVGVEAVRVARLPPAPAGRPPAARGSPAPGDLLQPHGRGAAPLAASCPSAVASSPRPAIPSLR